MPSITTLGSGHNLLLTIRYNTIYLNLKDHNCLVAAEMLPFFCMEFLSGLHVGIIFLKILIFLDLLENK